MNRRVFSFGILLLGLCLWCVGPSVGAGGHVNVYPVEGVINPVIVEYMAESITQSVEENATAVVFQLDTPGGLVESTRLIVKDLLNADIPVVVYVSPSGARAASAGTFITMAGHIAAMAPGTNIGAAHPVQGGGEDIEGDMRKKAENDIAAFARSIADKRGRNADWAEEAVRESVSITETEALEEKVIDVVAEDVPGLLAQLDGRKVTVGGDEVTLQTAQAEVRYRQMTWRQQALAVISHPQIALMLLSLGSLGLLIELYNPGLIFPGVIGAISVLPAFLCRQTDLLLAAGRTGKPVNVKKGQFLAPWDMQHVAHKIDSTDNSRILLTERGASFGYNNLVADMRSLAIMRSFGYPVVFDATHSVQLPGGAGGASSGQREFVPALTRAAVGVGIDALFIEVHADPDRAPSDGPNMLKLADLPELLEQVKAIDAMVRQAA